MIRKPHPSTVFLISLAVMWTALAVAIVASSFTR